MWYKNNVNSIILFGRLKGLQFLFYLYIRVIYEYLRILLNLIKIINHILFVLY